MKISKLLKSTLFGVLLIASLNAQEVDESSACTETYDICTTKCETLDNGYEQCIVKCDSEYEKCSESEENNKKDFD